MRVSFIIPHKGREEMLRRTIEGILALDFDVTQVEIIVVTQNATLTYQPPATGAAFTVIFRPANSTISASRNIGVKESSGEFLAFIDADILLSKNWLTVMIAEMQAKAGRVLTSAAQRCEPNAPRLEQIRTIMNESADTPVEFLDGRNLFLPRAVFEQTGGFPEHLVTCEDYFFTHRVHQLGEMYRTSKATYIHLGEDKRYGEMFHKEIWRGQSNLQSLKGRPIPLREWPSVIAPLYEASCATSFLVGILFRFPLMMMMSLLWFFLPVAAYALRLFLAGKGRIPLWEAIWFYLVYFPARAIGTVSGLFKQIH